jgi:hypothetical protein
MATDHALILARAGDRTAQIYVTNLLVADAADVKAWFGGNSKDIQYLIVLAHQYAHSKSKFEYRAQLSPASLALIDNLKDRKIPYKAQVAGIMSPRIHQRVAGWIGEVLSSNTIFGLKDVIRSIYIMNTAITVLNVNMYGYQALACAAMVITEIVNGHSIDEPLRLGAERLSYLTEYKYPAEIIQLTVASVCAIRPDTMFMDIGECCDSIPKTTAQLHIYTHEYLESPSSPFPKEKDIGHLGHLSSTHIFES